MISIGVMDEPYIKFYFYYNIRKSLNGIKNKKKIKFSFERNHKRLLPR